MLLPYLQKQTNNYIPRVTSFIGVVELPEKDITFITFVGRSEWAVVNSFWAILYHRDLKPSKVHILFRSSDEERAESCVEGLNQILEAEEIDCTIEKHEVKERFDLMGPADIVEEIMEKAQESKIVLDITPARKFMASGSLVQAMKRDVEDVYYLYIDEVDEAAKRPYLDIPLPRQELLEMTGGEHFVKD